MIRLTLETLEMSPVCSVSEKTLPFEIDLRLSLASLLTMGSILRSWICSSRLFNFFFFWLDDREDSLQPFSTTLVMTVVSSSLIVLKVISPALIAWIV